MDPNEPRALAPDMQDQIQVLVTYVNGVPQFHLDKKRVIMREGAIVLTSPKVEEIDEVSAYMLLSELCKSMAVGALVVKQRTEAVRPDLKVIQ